MKKPNLIPTTEACEYLRISRSTLVRLVNRGTIQPPLRVTARKHLYSTADLDAFLRRLRTRAARIAAVTEKNDCIPF